MRLNWPPSTYRLIFRLYGAALLLVTVVLVSFSLASYRSSVAPLTLAVVFMALVAGEHIKFGIAGLVYTLAVPPQIAACLLLPPPDALILSFASILILELISRRAWDKKVFNIAHTCVNVGVGNLVFAYLAPIGPGASPLTALTHPLATLLLISTFLLCDTPLVQIGLWCIHAGKHRITIHTLWEGILPELAAIPIGLLTAIMYQLAPPAALLLVVPLILLIAAFSTADRYVQEQKARVAADARAEEQGLRAALLEEVAHFGHAVSLKDSTALLDAITKAVAVVSGATSVEVQVAAHAGVPATRASICTMVGLDMERVILPELHELTDGECGTVGTITLRGRPQESNSTRDAVLTILLGQATLALANEALHQDAMHRATTDVLTGLHNRAGGLTHINRLIAQTRRSGTALSLIQIDLDGFKGINDTWGHGAGDAALIAVATALRATSRASDTPIRLGGDEFLIVLADTDLTDGHEVAARLCMTLNPLRFDYMDRTLTVGASVGIVTWEVAMRDDDLLRAADEAAYAAKKQGKGCVATIKDAHALVNVGVPPRDVQPLASVYP